MGTYASVTGSTTDEDIEQIAQNAAYAHFEQELSERERVLISVAVDHAIHAVKQRTRMRIEAAI